MMNYQSRTVLLWPDNLDTMPENSRPNIVYIQSDQHNPAVIGAYGDGIVETPNLDRLAADGAIFTAGHTAVHRYVFRRGRLWLRAATHLKRKYGQTIRS